MKVVVIGACGHIGSYLVPKLVKGGFKVVAISRGKSLEDGRTSSFRS